MSAAEKIIEELRSLPEPLAQEVLHFVRNLAKRNETLGSGQIMAAQQPVMERIWNHPEDDVWNDI